MNNKEKNIKVRIEETGYNTLNEIATNTDSTKSEVLRNSIPNIVTSKEFENLLTVHNLIYLEKKANECLDFFVSGNYLPIEKVSERFPAFVTENILNIKYPTYKVTFPFGTDEQNIDNILESLNLKKSDYFKYQDMIFLYNEKKSEKQLVYFLIGFMKTLEDNKKLMQKIITEFDAHGTQCTIFPAYYLKTFKLKLNKEKTLIEGIVIE